jgi:predicted ATPase/transcriptional regulator with XRE-family HTH domain
VDFTAPFGQWLKQQRARLDLTQGDLARRVGYSPETIRKVEAGVFKPSKQMLDLIADHIGVPAAQRDAFIAFALDKHDASNKEEKFDNLPSPATALIGREKDVAAVCRLLAIRGRSASSPSLRYEDLRSAPTPAPTPARLITLVGPPGVGKTRLSIEVAQQMASHFAGGVCWVELAPVVEPQTALAAIAQTLEIEDRPGTPALRLLQDHLRDKQMLLVLDNLEQILSEVEGWNVAPLIGQVLSAAPQVKVLCTSRELLRIAGEQSYIVQPLGDEAVQLFAQRAQRAQAVQPDFEITPANEPIISAICRKLDGLPLAIELAAARIGLFTPKEMLSRLNQRLSVLTGGARDLPARQRTLRATLEWSYSLLTQDEQALFRRLGVFAGGCTLHAVQTFLEIDNDLTLTAEDGLAALMDKSLLVRREDDKGESRYFLLETMREYALEKLKAHGEYDLWMERLGWYLVVMAEVSTNHLVSDALSMQFALSWAQSTPVVTELELMLAAQYGLFAPHRSNEELAWASLTFERTPLQSAPRQLALALFNRGQDYGLNGEHQEAAHFYDKSLKLSRELNDPFFTANIAERAGHNARERGDIQTARALLTESFGYFQGLQPDMATFMMTTMAEVEVVAEDADAAGALLTESETRLAQGDSVNKLPNHAWNLNHLGHVAALRGHHAQAQDCLSRSIAAFDKFEYEFAKAWGMLWCHQNMADSFLAEGKLTPARQHLAAALALFVKFSDKMVLSWCLATLAGVCTLDEEPERGATLWGASEALRERIGCRIAPASRLNRERTVALLREQLGEAEFARLTAEGAQMDVDEAVAFAREGVGA